MSSLAMRRPLGDLQLAYSYCLSQLSHLSERSALKLKQRFPTPESWFQLTPSERQEATKVALGFESPTILTTNFDALIDRAFNDLRNHEREGIRTLSIDSAEYPELLKQIEDPPLVLFVKGAISAVLNNSNVAVVGTRDATATGERVAFKIAKWLADHNWCVVSGLAKGIDAAAHKGTLETKFPTAAVMATPLNKIYPAENRELANEILDRGGCWISEFPLWKKPYRSAFVQRDRIQSGVSVAVIPVQTDIEGGTMHTVRFAEKQGRLLLCPRPIRDDEEQHLKQYAGIRNLIDNRRAIAFSNEEYEQVLQQLADRRAKLLKTSSENLPVTKSSEAALNEDKNRMGADEPKQNRPGRKSRRLQGGFPFAEEVAKKPKKRIKEPSAKELQFEIKFLQQLCDEIIDAKGPNGARVSDVGDVRKWLEEKVRVLRAKAGLT